MPNLQVLSVSSELFPLIKTGGLADVTGALPAALAKENVAIRSLLPAYPAVLRGLKDATAVHAYKTLFGGPARILAGTSGGIEIFALDAPHLFNREGNPYVASNGSDWPDNVLRFAALGRVGADIALGAIGGYRPDVVHAHDWQAGLTAAYLRYSGQRAPGTVFTIHNMAFPGLFPSSSMPEIGLPWEAFTVNGLEYYDKVSFLKSGIVFSDRITTVSPTYATEILTRDNGMGFDVLLRSRSQALSGILNGIDDVVWNPQTDKMLAKPYSAKSLKGRAENKSALQKTYGLPVKPETLLFGVVSRLSSQKGLDLLLEAIPTLIDLDAQLVLLGSGDRWMEEAFNAAAARYPDRIACRIGYDEPIAHLIQAGSDALLVPSRFEPCGLTQLCALRYGAVPVVARVGGLADTIVDANEMAVASGAATGLQFSPVTADALRAALHRTKALYRDTPGWTRMVLAGMATDVSWRRPARRTADLYRAIAADTEKNEDDTPAGAAA
ncbi:glycogen synthase GlgA [Lichenihabitans psoromatis]|uniref:glycogen synthase GlgA n=1 Tax=Lichenihabitans psoromatis TaxID=2528642 RepID=UPI00103839A5|nr:glycogen synthase GlgA [Lichenihabitans psoromatis]